jgi:hypothetical protein
MSFFRKYSNKEIIFSICGIITIIILFNLIQPSGKEFLCARYSDLIKKEIKGTVQEVYIDEKNHNFRIVSYISEDQEKINKIDLYFDKSFLFEKLKMTDIISKESGSTNVLVNDSLIFVLDFGVNCQ